MALSRKVFKILDGFITGCLGLEENRYLPANFLLREGRFLSI